MSSDFVINILSPRILTSLVPNTLSGPQRNPPLGLEARFMHYPGQDMDCLDWLLRRQVIVVLDLVVDLGRGEKAD